MPRLSAALVLLAAALLASPATAQGWDPLAFFEGRTHNVGRIEPTVGHARALVVDGVGRRLPDGALQLRQTIRQGDEAPTARTWRIAPAGPDRWTLTGTDMRGAGRGYREGDHVILEWRRGDLNARQRLTLRSDGRVTNAMTLGRLGLPFARITEVIERR